MKIKTNKFKFSLQYFLLPSFLVFVYFIPSMIPVFVNCQSQFGGCEKGISTTLLGFSGKSIRGAKKEIKKFLDNNFLVSDYSLSYKLPNTLAVNLVLKKPAFGVRQETSQEYFLIDRSGKVLSRTTENKSPYLIVMSHSLEEGKNVSEDMLTALGIMEGVSKMYQVNSGVLKDGSLAVVLPNQLKVIFPVEGEVDVMLGALRLINSHIETELSARVLTEIDLRFANPVLR